MLKHRYFVHYNWVGHFNQGGGYGNCTITFDKLDNGDAIRAAEAMIKADTPYIGKVSITNFIHLKGPSIFQRFIYVAFLCWLAMTGRPLP